MNRAIVPLVVLALAGGVYFLLSYNPKGGAVPTAAPASTAEGQAITDAMVPLPPKAPPVTEASEAPPPAPASAVESGPFEMSLGEYQISLRDSTRRMRMVLVMTTDNPVTLRELRGRREQIQRMIFFLSAHRTEESMVGTAGRDRFLGDLKERLANIVRTGNLDKVELTTWALEDLPAAPASN